MALPTAQLGQLSNINVPSYVPTTVIPKKQSILEQALLAFLMNTAGNAGGQLVQNVMAPDYAPEGQKRAFLGKLVQGPTTTRQESEATKAREFSAGQSQLDREAAMKRHTEQIGAQQFLAGLGHRAAATNTQAEIASNEKIAGMKGRQSLEQLQRQLTGETENLERSRANAVEIIKLKEMLGLPKTEAEIGLMQAQAEKLRTEAMEPEKQRQWYDTLRKGQSAIAGGASETARAAARGVKPTMTLEQFLAENPNSSAAGGQELVDLLSQTEQSPTEDLISKLRRISSQVNQNMQR